MTPATTDRADRLPRSLRRLGYDLVDAERQCRFHITREGSKQDETAGLDLAGVERWDQGASEGVADPLTGQAVDTPRDDCEQRGNYEPGDSPFSPRGSPPDGGSHVLRRSALRGFAAVAAWGTNHFK